MMERSLIMAICGATMLCLGSFSVSKKSHSIVLSKLEHLSTDNDWIVDYKAKFVKTGKSTKVFNATFTLKEDLVGDNVTVEIKVYQQSGGKYVKAPLDFPRQSLCKFLENNEVFWPCIQEHSNLPKKCPIEKGDYWIKNLNPNNCNYGSTMPPNMPENYRGEMYCWLGLKPLLKMIVYAKLKKNINLL